MSESQGEKNVARQARSSRVFGWFDRRTGLDGLLREGLDEPIPGGARFA